LLRAQLVKYHTILEFIERSKKMFISKSSTYGNPPAIILDNPKFARNVSSAIRLASAFDFRQIWFTGNRVQLEIEQAKRLPREERMKGYKSVEVINTDYPFDAFSKDIPVVGIDLFPGAISLNDFWHPENAVYVFGPEDGSIQKSFRSHCHYIVYIPTKHCLNLATAISSVLTARMLYLDQRLELEENRGFGNFDLVGTDDFYRENMRV